MIALHDVLAWLRAFEGHSAPSATVLPPPIVESFGRAAPSLVSVEVLRANGKTKAPPTKAHLVVEAALWPDVVPAALSSRGFVVRPGDASFSAERPGEWILVERMPQALRIDHHLDLDGATAEDVHAAIQGLPTLAPFAPVARPPALVRSFGLRLCSRHGLRGLLGVHRDLERLADDEEALATQDFAPRPADDDDAVWRTADGARSVVWMGGTIYGYVGPVPTTSVGGWA